MSERLEKSKAKLKSLGSKIFAGFAGVAAVSSGALSAFAADTEAVSAAKDLMNTATAEMNIGNIVAIIGAGIGAVIGLFLAWWGARKLVNMLMAAFKKGKVKL